MKKGEQVIRKCDNCGELFKEIEMEQCLECYRKMGKRKKIYLCRGCLKKVEK